MDRWGGLAMEMTIESLFLADYQRKRERIEEL
jgi:hypothetical protein